MPLTPSLKPEYIQLRVDKIVLEAPEVKTFYLTSEHPLSYKAGQFLTFVFNSFGKEERRSYSLSSSPDAHDQLAVTIKRVTNGRYSRPFIDSVKEGQVLTSIQPAGQFTLPDEIDRCKQLFFFAAGVGITPIYSIIKTALIKHPQLQLVLVYSNSSTKDAVFYNELLQLQQQYRERLKLELLFSSSADLTRARLSKWLLPQLLEVYSTGDKQEQLFYTCGPFPYMRMVALTLEEQAYKQAQIRRELFDTTDPVQKAAPADKDAHMVTVHLPGATKQFTAQYPQTILKAAQTNNITLPYSCETGKCGSCTMRCITGSVWMSYNEVLTVKDLDEGKVLTCTGYPIGGDVSLESL